MQSFGSSCSEQSNWISVIDGFWNLRKAAALKIAVEVDNVPTAKAKVLQLVTAERIIYKVRKHIDSS
ncbi:Hypothetical predicted protein [Olea europaea subsp. europaea]|uniref:Uncharacterized protein n=1 Tax=Olea europaea subsp. europaea TaxID=158383 RepID=A0A8S0T877_OLEEU|nr:Hypothetical predicted protein [Olea europaea subsp. europaea]